MLRGKTILPDAIVLMLLLALAPAPCSAATQAASPPAPNNPADPAIVAALAKISPPRIALDIRQLASFGNRNTLSSMDSTLPAGVGIDAARDWIQAEFSRYSQSCGNCLEVKTDSFIQNSGTRVPSPTQMSNVYAVLRGSDPVRAKHIFLVTGHYDSRNTDVLDVKHPAPGANDDASGTAVSLECARVLSQMRFPATLVFLAVAGEEQGLYGSKHFADMAKAEGWEIDGVLNNDIVGGDRAPGQRKDAVRVFSEGLPASADQAAVAAIRAAGGENDSPSRQLARYVREIGAVYFPPQVFGPRLIFRPDRYLRGGDQISFNADGFPAVRFTEYRENFNHQHQNVRVEQGIQYGDLMEFVDTGYTANVARLNAAALASLASAPPAQVDVQLQTKQLENTSTVDWQAALGAEAARYEVLERSTAAPDWESVHAVGKATRYLSPDSKDNVIFGVRAIDNRGHRSLTVIPVPAR